MAVLGVPTTLFILYILALLIGLAFIPLFAWTIGPMTGSLAEGLSNILWMVSNLGVRTPLLVQREADEYEIERGDPDLEPRAYWTRWALARFGITFEPTDQAFDSALIDDTLRHELNELAYTDGGAATVDIDRGGQTWFAHKDDLNGILVPIGQKLAELKNAAGPDISLEAYTAALEKYGGDTSGSSNKMRLVGSVIFSVLGLGMGWLVFF